MASFLSVLRGVLDRVAFVLAFAIRQNNNIHGFVHNSLECKIIFYEEDLLLFILEPQSSVLALMDMINTFGNLSEYLLNWAKSELMPVGGSISQSI